MFGLIPALQSTRLDLNRSLKERAGGARVNTRVRSVLVIAQTALALMLLTGAGLLIRSSLALQQVDSGFNTEGVLTVRVSAPASQSRNPSSLRGSLPRSRPGRPWARESAGERSIAFRF